MLPSLLPPSFVMQIKYFLARVISGDILDLKWDYDYKPMKGLHVYLDRLFRLYLLAQLSGNEPWWLQIIADAATWWRGREISELWMKVLEEVRTSINLFNNYQFLSVLDRLNRGGAKRLGASKIKNWLSVNKKTASHFYASIEFGFREVLIPSFQRLGLRRYVVTGSLQGLTDGFVVEEEILCENEKWYVILSEEPVLQKGNSATPTELTRQRITLHTGLYQKHHRLWSPSPDLSYNTVSQGDTVGYYQFEEPCSSTSMKKVQLTPQETSILAILLGYQGLLKEKISILEALGIQRGTVYSLRKSLLDENVTTFGYLPKRGLVQLTDEITLKVDGRKEEILDFRDQIHSNIPLVVSYDNSEKASTTMVVRLFLNPGYGPVFVKLFERTFAEREFEGQVDFVLSKRTYRTNSILQILNN